MNPAKVERSAVRKLTDLPNVGPATQGDLHVLGITQPEQLRGKCAYQMFDQLCQVTGVQHDNCMIDVFLSITDFANGAPPQPWWDYTPQRKAKLKQSKVKPSSS